MNYVIFSREADADTTALGGKARALKVLGDAGLPIPDWFVVSPDAFWASLPAEARQQLAHATSDGDVAAAVAQVEPSADVREALVRGIEQLCADGSLVAVRSSASDEDGAAHSFAGQLETFLFVRPADVADRVAAVWRSGFSPRIVAYRRQHCLELAPKPPAVLVQRMIDACTSGVAFSADPVSGRRGIAVVSGAPGLGTGIVSGDCDADTWQVDRGGTITGRHIIRKPIVHRRDPGSIEGVRAEAVADDQASRPALADEAVTAVAAMARRAERYFGRPQDIEWAYGGDELYLLQSRPITSLAPLPDPDGHLTLWDNSNIVESYSGVTTPLTFSFASEIYQHVYRQFCRMMRVPASQIAKHDQTFRNMLGFVRGRLYYNLLNWYRVLALLPGFTVSRQFMEQMMGVREGLPEPLVQEISARRGIERIADAMHMANSMIGLVVQHFLINRRVRAFYDRLDEALAPPNPSLADRRPDELVAHYRELRERLLLHWDAPLVNDFFAMIFYGALRKLAQSWCGDREGTLQNDLISGQGELVSAEPAVRLRRLANLARENPSFTALLVNAPARHIEEAMASHPPFAAEYQAYLDKFGERSVNELKLETATLHDDPLPLLRSIGRLAQQSPSPSTVSGESLREAARHRVKVTLANHPLRRLAFGWVLRHARARVRDRENLRLERTRLFGRVRRTFLELGRRFSAVNVLDNPRDIFYLEVDEVLAFVEGRSTSTSLRDLVAIRRREFEEYERLPAPADRFETRGIVYHGHAFQDLTAPAIAVGDERRGTGCSPGVVRGPVRVVTDPRDIDLERRAVLVAEHTDPGWIMIFPSALGVLVERGSLLSHAAIVARELGIPGVVSIPGITKWLRDGDWVEFDGSTGIVRRIEKPDAGEASVAQ